MNSIRSIWPPKDIKLHLRMLIPNKVRLFLRLPYSDRPYVPRSVVSFQFPTTLFGRAFQTLASIFFGDLVEVSLTSILALSLLSSQAFTSNWLHSSSPNWSVISVNERRTTYHVWRPPIAGRTECLFSRLSRNDWRVNVGVRSKGVIAMA